MWFLRGPVNFEIDMDPGLAGCRANGGYKNLALIPNLQHEYVDYWIKS